MIRIGIILGSTRPNRNGLQVAHRRTGGAPGVHYRDSPRHWRAGCPATPLLIFPVRYMNENHTEAKDAEPEQIPRHGGSDLHRDTCRCRPFPRPARYLAAGDTLRSVIEGLDELRKLCTVAQSPRVRHSPVCAPLSRRRP
jgi:hypothetical protein